MTEFPDTRYSLLVELGSDAQRQAWEQFVEIYQPIIYRIACRKGLQDADARDLTQQVLLSVVKSIDRWQKSNDQTRFRHWLRRIAKNAVINALTRKPLDKATGDTAVHELLQQTLNREIPTQQVFEIERKRELYHRAAWEVQRVVDPTTWLAFQLTSIEGKAIKDVAKELGKSVGTVYASRSRVMKRLQDEVTALEEQEHE